MAVLVRLIYRSLAALLSWLALLARSSASKNCPCRKPHPCRSCSVLILMKHPAESVASPNSKAGDLIRSRERRGQWLERRAFAMPWDRPNLK